MREIYSPDDVTGDIGSSRTLVDHVPYFSKKPFIYNIPPANQTKTCVPLKGMNVFAKK